jgi:O-antigen ligase
MIDAMSAATDRPLAARIDRAPPARNSQRAIIGGPQGKALIVLIIAVNAMAVLPDGVKYLYVQHRSLYLYGERGVALEFPLARAVSLAAAIVLFLVSVVIILRRRHLDRNVFGLIILLLALLIPYIISPSLPGTEDAVRVALAATVIVAVWSIEAPVEGLKWVPIAGSFIGAYSIIGGLINLDYMNNITDATKLIVPNWALAGPFSHGNFLGIYSVLALALTPLIVSVRWRILHASILCMTIVLAASRTAMVAAGMLALWWIICWFRSRISLRVVGTALIGCCAATVVMLPLLNSDPHAFVGRGYAWAASLSAWRESPLVGLGVHFVGTQFRTNSDSWAFSHGHNLFVDTLLRSGLVGICILAIILVAAVRSTRSLDVSSHQTAFFGYLIAFFVASCTEVNWTLLPTWPLFPVVGFVFAILICREPGRPGDTKQADTTTLNVDSRLTSRVVSTRSPKHGWAASRRNGGPAS